MTETIMTANSNASQLQTLRQIRRPTGGGRGRSAWLRPLGLIACTVGGLGLAAAGYAAAGAADGTGWREGMRLAFVQRAVSRALDGVGASSAQEAKIHDIVAARFAELGQNPDERAAMRKQALDLLAVPTIDRTAVETMRLAKLAAHVEAMAQHRPMGGPWGHWCHSPMMRGQEGDPDGSPDEGLTGPNNPC
jgi:protein CpxP